MATKIQLRRGTAASWAAANPILDDGELGIEKDTLIFKVGNGVTKWNDLIAVPGLDFETKSHASDTFATKAAVATKLDSTVAAADYAPKQAAPTTATVTGIYERRLNVYNLKPSHLRRTRAKLAQARAGTGFCKIATLGHSMVAGIGATSGVTGFPEVLVGMLDAAGFPRAGTGLVAGYRGALGQDAQYGALAAGWGQLGGSGSILLNSTTTNPLVFTSTRSGTVVEVAYSRTAGPFTVSIDGGAGVTVTPPGGNAAMFYTVTGLADTTHTVTITRTSGTTLIFGVEVRHATRGVRLYNAGIGGMKADALADANWFGATTWAGSSANWAADLLTLGPITTNDAFAGTAVATWKGHMQGAITRAKAGGGDVIMQTDTPVNGIDQTAYIAALYELADTNDLPLIDMHDRWGTYTSANGLGLIADGTHPNLNGYAEWARALLLALAV